MFIDWTGSGNPFDLENIGISAAMEADDNKHRPPKKNNSGCGCSSTLLMITIAIALIVGLVIN